jgi:DNA-binding transcriptional LysR family regulator
MELRHLRYFIGVAEELHFGRAAQRLGISQPPLSQQIRALEEELGVSLFDRSSRRVALTAAGRLFLVEARRTLAQADHAMTVARRAELGEIGELNLGFSTSAPFTAVVSQALYSFRQRHPGVRLLLNEMTRDEQIEGLAARELDVGFIRGFTLPVLPPEIRVLPLIEEPLLLAMRSGHALAELDRPVRIADLADESFVLFGRERGVGFNEHVALLCRRAGFDPHIVQEASGLATMLGLVAAGFGITMISASLGALHADNIVYRPLAEPDAISRMWLLQRGNPTVACQAFVAAVTDTHRTADGQLASPGRATGKISGATAIPSSSSARPSSTVASP